MIRVLICILSFLLSSICICAEPKTLDDLLAQYEQATEASHQLLYIDSIFAAHAFALSPDMYFELAQRKYDLLKSSTDTVLLAQTFHTLGKAYISRNVFDTAMTHFLTGLALSEAVSDSVAIAKMYNGIAHCYQWSDKEKSILYYQKAIAFSPPNENPQFIGTQYMNLGSQLVSLKRFEESIDMYERAIVYLKETNAVGVLGSTYMNMGVTYYRQGQINKSIESQELALTYLSPTNHLRSYITTLQNLGVNYYQVEDYGKAEAYTQQSLLLAQQHNIGDRVAKAFQILVAIHEQRADYRTALEYYRQYFDIQDSIVEARKDEKISRLLTEFETEKKEGEIKRLDTENQLKDVQIQKSQQERILWIGGVISLLIILGLLVYFFQNNRTQNQLLESKNGVISQALSEKETLLKEIHHRVKNNLQVISSLLSLQAKQIEDSTALEAMKEGQNRVKSMALIHQNLYQENNLVGVNMQEYVEKLIDSLIRSYQVDTTQIDVLKDIDPVSFDVDTIIPLGLILNELISNVLKYAFEGREVGIIEVQLKAQKEAITMRVADNGIGLPSDFDPMKNRSLGYRLIRSFAKKLNATVDIQGQAGTSVSIHVPHLQPI